MKKQNFLRKLLALTLATTMTLAVGISAVAGTGVQGNGSVLSSVSLKKIFEVENGVVTPNVTFSYTVTTGNGGTVVSGGTSVAGESGGLTTSATIEYSSSDVDGESSDEDGTVDLDIEKSTTLSIDSSVFDEPGIYEYVVNETTENVAGIIYDTNVYYVYLYVYVDTDGSVTGTLGTLYVGYAEIVDPDGETDSTSVKKDLVYTNTYNTANVSVTKRVSGNGADWNDTWEFTVIINCASNDASYRSFYYTYGSSGTGVISDDDDNGIVTFEVTLGKDETLTIYGLVEGDSYEITESSGSYTVTYDSETYNNTSTLSNISSEIDSNVTDKTHYVNNYKSVGTPTGIVLNYLPYILLLLVAGGIGFVFFRRRRADY